MPSPSLDLDNEKEAGLVVLSLAVLAVVLAGAVRRPWGTTEAAFAIPGALIVIVSGALSWRDAWSTIERLGPTVGFLAGILAFGHLCAEEGVFEFLGAIAARLSGHSPRRLLMTVVAVAALVTAVLTLDATVVLLTPVVLRTTRRLGIRGRPHLYACAHLANSGSLLLPVSNLTNLLAFTATGLSFGHFTALMAAPWAVACTLDWAALRLFFKDDLGGIERSTVPLPRAPRYALCVLALTVSGFVVTSAFDIAPAWAALAGTLLLAVPRFLRGASTPLIVFLEANPGFCLFVLALGIIVDAAGVNGLHNALAHLIPQGESLTALLGVALLAAALANVVNNLPATLALLPLVMHSHLSVLALLIGVNVGPNLTFIGSLATLLWRRLLPDEERPSPKDFHLLGAISAVPIVVVATVVLWLSAKAVG